MPEFQKILAANRGEIAIRIFRACRDLGLSTVAMYSNEDTLSLFRTEADESYIVGENMSPLGAYLDIPSIIDLAKKHGVSAIHPGYGFLSENANFAKACEEAGIKFIGPPSHILAKMGDKLSAKAIAKECGVPTIPGTEVPLKDADEALEKALEFGLPIMLKAAAGGGGKGMRKCETPEEVKPAFDLVSSEARKAFGNGDIFIEKFVSEPKHIEMQILADEHGNVMHLGERDCSLQRRYQKVVEFTPAFSVPEETRQRIYADALKLARSVNYVNAGTIEFLVDGKTGEHYFIEVNPRVQVEHTITELVTGIDIVRSQILIAQGYPLSHPEIGLTSQEDVKLNGFAIQCRVTTEDPANNFAPDTGKITAYRSGGGFGVRLDGGNAVTGAVISPYYDSLLVKVCTWDNTFAGVCRKALRAISELRIRGVKTNIPFLANILSHPVFKEGGCDTKFIDDTKELYDFVTSRDRATKALKFISNIQVADPMGERPQYNDPRIPVVKGVPGLGLKQMLDKDGPKAVADWVLKQKKLLITDTTMRDAHQSLFSTRMRTRDMLDAGEATSDILGDCFSLEMWGGATFDVAYRFLHEDPWERVDKLREKIPNIMFQMLLRGANTVGYENAPDNLVRAFIAEAAKTGIDVFRVFDSLNWLPGMELAIEEVIKHNKICEGTICYTGNILDPTRDKYTLKYYVNLAKALEKRGCHILGIKDMSGLLKPYAAKKLVETLKGELSIPIHLHSHDTSGSQIAAYMLAAEAGVDIVDTAMSPLSGLTSQPTMGSIVSSLQRTERDTGFDLERIQLLDDYWADVRDRYEKLDGGLKYPMTEIYRYEIPGGQYTNLKPQVESLGLGNRFEEVKEMFKTVNDMLGDIVKVTPSSKMVGDFAIFMVQNDLTPENIVERGEHLAFPDSVVSYFKGMMGQPEGGFPPALQKVVLKGETPITVRPGELLDPVDFDAGFAHMKQFTPNPTNRDVISWYLYPKVVEEYYKHNEEYGAVTSIASSVFFNGMNYGETTRVNIEDGKTLVIKYLGTGETNDDGTRNFQFELNGMRREVSVADPTVVSTVKQAIMAEPENKNHVGASIPGMVSKFNVKPGDKVAENDVLAVVEAMKMEINIVARAAGVVDQVLTAAGQSVKAGELMATIKAGT
jgi:pyruvate carboxylase